jgi:rhamnose utilization protein RhaD (predicted bifunctional aldolase and dehydrogenase)
MGVENKRMLIDGLVELSREFGREQLVILGEGNTSAKISDESFLVKASGSKLGSLVDVELTECLFERIMPVFERAEISEVEVEEILAGSRKEPNALKPSIETFFHAYLLTLPGVRFVGHTHPIPINQILCSPLGQRFASRRQCPDEVVCCGPVSLYIPYEDPGLILARRIKDAVEAFQTDHGRLPRVILLESHGVITFGPSIDAVRTAMQMTVKAAQIFIGAQALGGARPLPDSDVDRIENRLDEEYRRKMLRMN